MNFNANITVPTNIASQLEAFCHTPPLDCGRDEILFDQEVTFSDGIRAVVQVVAPNSPEDGETAWTQCVLYDKNGRELSVSEPGESLIGPFHMDYFTDSYTVNVVMN
jgi:hypothetical protein